jgi:hypothetical protein
MRHVICASPVTPRPRRMGEAAAAARLVTTAGFAQRPAARRARTAGRAVNLAAVATAADHHLDAAAPAQKEPGRQRRRARCAPEAAWTRFPGTAIIPPHSCPRTVQPGHGAEANGQVEIGAVPIPRSDRSYRTRCGRSARKRRRGARRPRVAQSLPRRRPGWANRRPPTRAAPSRVRALRGARGSPLFATWTTLFPSLAELFLFRRNHADSHRRRHHHPFPGAAAANIDVAVSRAGELHPRALAEPDVRLSPHPAPIAQPRPCNSPQWANRRG